MDALEAKLREQCLQSPHWQQIALQGFWYGLISWAITCAEDMTEANLKEMPIQSLMEHADKEFASWPADWLQEDAEAFVANKFTEAELQGWFSRLDTIFRDCVPTDLDIFSCLADGQELTEEQWTRLYDALAFQKPQLQPQQSRRNKQRTRRTHGRRALTPMRGRRALTRQRPYANVIKLK